MTREEFDAACAEVRSQTHDPEVCHSRLDDLMLRVLDDIATDSEMFSELGYAAMARAVVDLEAEVVKACGWWACA